MSCYHPFLALPDYDSPLSENGRHVYKLQGSFSPKYKELYPDAIKVPCGKCLGCRLDYSRTWADRMMYELKSNDGIGCFLTLTYDNENVPFHYFDRDTGEVFDGLESDNLDSVQTLRKRDVQLFMKRLRKMFPERKIRFYACGEYGSKTKRPHYHLIIFGCSVYDFHDRRVVGKNELGDNFFSSDSLALRWPAGFHVLADVSYKTCAYVARYVTKKIYGDTVPYGADQEFVLMSRRPGLGSFYYEDHPDCVERSKIFLNDSNGSVQVSVPRYFKKKFSLTNPEAYENMIKERSEFSNDRELLRLKKTDLSYIDQLEVDENEKISKTKILFNLREEVL